MQTVTESAPMTVAEFLKRLDSQKQDAEVVRRDPTTAARTIRVLEREHAQMKAYLEATAATMEQHDMDKPAARIRSLLAALGAK